MNKINIVSLASVFMFVSLIFAACSGDSGAMANDANISEVKNTLELDKCTDSLLGETVLVTEDDAYYTCIKGKWMKMDVDGKSSSSKEKSSSSKEKSSSSSELKVLYGTLTDTRDKRTYKTVTVGTQTWMAENLNYADSMTTPSLKGKSWCYDNIAANCDETGRLYTWAAAIDSVKLANDKENPRVCGYGVTCTLPAKVQGVCPAGWRLPKFDDWKILITLVNGSSTKMKNIKLKSTSGWSDGDNGSNSFGFSVFPTGHRYSDGYFYNAGIEASFWDASETNKSEAGCMSFFIHYDDALSSLGDKDYGFSVRCIEDADLKH